MTGGFGEWAAGRSKPEPPASSPSPMADFEAAAKSVPEPRIVDPTTAQHVTQEMADGLFPLLDTFRGRMTFRARVLVLQAEGLCPGCVGALGDLMDKQREAWDQN